MRDVVTQSIQCTHRVCFYAFILGSSESFCEVETGGIFETRNRAVDTDELYINRR